MTKKTTRKIAKPSNKGKSAAKPAIKASPPKRGPGQPTLLTQDVSDTICANLEEGLSLKDSAILAGVGYSTVQEWQRWGWDGKSPLYSEFSGAIERARAAARRKYIKALHSEATKPTAPDLSAARYMLAHSDPEQYAERQSIDARIEHKGGPSIVIRHIPADYRRK